MRPILPTTTEPRELRAPAGAYRIAEATPAVAKLEEALGGVLVSFSPYGETWEVQDEEGLPRFVIYMDGAKLIGPDGKTRARTTIPGYGSGVDGKVREQLCAWALGVLEGAGALKEKERPHDPRHPPLGRRRRLELAQGEIEVLQERMKSLEQELTAAQDKSKRDTPQVGPSDSCRALMNFIRWINGYGEGIIYGDGWDVFPEGVSNQEQALRRLTHHWREAGYPGLTGGAPANPSEGDDPCAEPEEVGYKPEGPEIPALFKSFTHEEFPPARKGYVLLALQPSDPYCEGPYMPFRQFWSRGRGKEGEWVCPLYDRVFFPGTGLGNFLFVAFGPDGNMTNTPWDEGIAP